MAMVIHQPQPGTQTSNDLFPVSATRTYPSASAHYEQVVQSSELFLEKLRAFHASFGTKFMVPTVGGKALDLHRLFVEVTSRGGIEKVIKDRRWKEVVLAFSFPTTITSASFVLRKYYMALVYHFEQVYYFSRHVPSYSPPDLGTRGVDDGSVSREEDASMSHSLENLNMQAGCSVTGTIDGKFDSGYLVTISMGSEDLKGVLYHIPPVIHMSSQSQSQSQPTTTYSSDMPTRRSRKRSRLASRDPSQPKSNRNGYNFFFSEHYARLKPHHHGQEKTIVKKIGHLWNNLTDAEKQVYQEKGARDKERYKSEMLKYKSSQHDPDGL